LSFLFCLSSIFSICRRRVRPAGGPAACRFFAEATPPFILDRPSCSSRRFSCSSCVTRKLPPPCHYDDRYWLLFLSRAKRSSFRFPRIAFSCTCFGELSSSPFLLIPFFVLIGSAWTMPLTLPCWRPLAWVFIPSGAVAPIFFSLKSFFISCLMVRISFRGPLVLISGSRCLVRWRFHPCFFQPCLLGFVFVVFLVLDDLLGMVAFCSGLQRASFVERTLRPFPFSPFALKLVSSFFGEHFPLPGRLFFQALAS